MKYAGKLLTSNECSVGGLLSEKQQRNDKVHSTKEKTLSEG
jgi:hypothetical protein